MTTAEDLLAHVNGTAGDLELVVRCVAEAAALVDAYVGVNEVPAVVIDRAVIEVGSELFHRRNAPGGITQFATVDGSSPVRMARDPMLGAYPILDRFVPAGLA